MSVRSSTGLASTCSGDMYCTVPTIVPCPVNASECDPPLWLAARLDIVTVNPEVGASSAPSALASPKSKIFAPDLVNMMLLGFKSRCITPARCACSSPSAISAPIVKTCSNRRGPLLSLSASVSPTVNSITRNRVPSCSPTSYNWQTLGWFSPEIARASRSNRSIASGFSERCRGRILIATVRFSLVSRA